MVELTLDGVTKRFDDAQGTETAVDDVSLTVEDELLVLLGPSGCGKTTTLRMIAGLESVTAGRISIGGRDVTDRHPSERSIAMAFQDYGLYRMMSVRENMGYGLKHSTSLSRDERRAEVEEMAAMLGIGDLLDRSVTDLSGGQKQRVALGRAMVRDPDVFLLDEPLASLDAKLRSEMRTELQQIQAELDVTTVYVTHDQKEAMTMADRIAVLDGGVLQQVGPPESVYGDPSNRFVADFLGNPAMNQLRATVDREGDRYVLVRDVGGRTVTLAALPDVDFDPTARREVVVGLRPETLRIGETPDDAPDGSRVDAPDGGPIDGPDVNPDGGPTFEAEVAVTEYQGSDNFVHLRVGDADLTAVVSPAVKPATGEVVTVSVAPDDVYLFDPDTGETLLAAGVDRQARTV